MKKNNYICHTDANNMIYNNNRVIIPKYILNLENYNNFRVSPNNRYLFHDNQNNIRIKKRMINSNSMIPNKSSSNYYFYNNLKNPNKKIYFSKENSLVHNNLDKKSSGLTN